MRLLFPAILACPTGGFQHRLGAAGLLFVLRRSLLSGLSTRAGVSFPTVSFHCSSHVNDVCFHNEDNEPIAIRRTRDWVLRTVIGLNLCPFAELPFRQGFLDIRILRGSDVDLILEGVKSELFHRHKSPGTTLVVCPELFPDCFEDYLQVCEAVERDVIEKNEELLGSVQVAPFHPLFQFQGSDSISADNWTNRSPYPIFHIIREDEVARAVDKLDGDAGKVWRRNVALLEALDEQLGREGFIRILTSKASQDEMMKTLQIMRSIRGVSDKAE